MTDDVPIPDKPTQDEVHPWDFIYLLYGPPKIGKSTFFSKFKDALYISTEAGLKFLKVRKAKVTQWPEFTNVVEQLEDGRATASFIVVDTVDNLAKFCLNHVCDERGIEHPSDQEWGKGWEAYFDEWHHWIVRLTSLGIGVAFIGHQVEREVTSRSIKITKTVPQMPTTVYRSINNLADFIFCCGFERKRVKSKNGETKTVERRVIYTKPSETRDAGDRSSALPPVMALDFDEFKSVFYS